MTDEEYVKLVDLAERMEAGYPLRKEDAQVVPIVDGWAVAWGRNSRPYQYRYRLLMPGQYCSAKPSVSASKTLRDAGWIEHARAMMENDR